jgi:transposase-like protein
MIHSSSSDQSQTSRHHWHDRPDRKHRTRRLLGRDAGDAPRALPLSRLCGEIDEKVATFLDRPLEGDWPYVWLDATYLKVRQNGRIVSVAVIIAVGVNSAGRREVLGMTIGASEAETFWIEFLRKLTRRGAAGAILGR